MDNKMFIAGVSGGPDSMAMLDLYKNKIKAVCFVNYYDRNDTHIDERIVKNYCFKNNILLHCLNVTKDIYLSIESNNFQDQCRKIRYDFYNEIACLYDLNDVLIAHNFDDFVETAYSQIIKKKDNLYLGIKKNSKYKDINVIRPLLNCRKDDLQKYCDQNNIEYIIDSTNIKDIYERNRHRKYLKNLSSEEFNQLLNYINEYNLKNYQIDLKIKDIYNLWKASNYSLELFNKNDEFYKYELIYFFLSDNYVSQINKNKINHIIEFIKFSNMVKLFRISKNTYISKRNKNLEIIVRS